MPWRGAMSRRRWVLALVVAGLAGGGLLRLAADGRLAGVLWAATTVAALVPLALGVIRELRAGRAGVDLIALLAMAGALALGEYLAGAVVALMLAGGEVLEEQAGARARRELSLLVSRAPRRAHRYQAGELATVPVEEVRPGDLLLVRPGEVVPVDGLIAGSPASLDESALTGEARLAERGKGERVASGVVNAGGPFDLKATATAGASTYAGIVRLVEQAQASKAPLVRLADRYAVWFLPLTLAVAAAAWLLSGDPVRALAVLVVATPCPLILAAPIAIVGGVSRAARLGVVVKGGGPLEVLGRAERLLLDKTGTVTAGRPELSEVVAVGAWTGSEVLRLAASLETVSPHVLAEAVVRAGHEQGLEPVFPSASHEEAGEGVEGIVEGRRVRLGKRSWAAGTAELPQEVRRAVRRGALEGSSVVFVAVDGELAGVLLLKDRIRASAPRTLRELRRIGFRDVVLLTGDHPEFAAAVGTALGIDHVLAERTPVEKVQAVEAARALGITVMVGDGLNDAPALAAADVGIAIGARGATASSEAADVVLVADRLERLVDAVLIARRSRRIALESIWAGMALSGVAMVFAAAGYLPPVAGAVLQEAIDVAVILNALRALGAGWRRRRPAPPPDLVAAGDRFRAEHREQGAGSRELRALADRLDDLPPAEARRRLEAAHRFLAEVVLPHERAEEETLYPGVAALIGGRDPTAPMSRAHNEIAHLVRLFGRLVADLPAAGPSADDLPDLRRLLYGLNAILELHRSQEEEGYLALIPSRAEVDAPV